MGHERERKRKTGLCVCFGKGLLFDFAFTMMMIHADDGLRLCFFSFFLLSDYAFALPFILLVDVAVMSYRSSFRLTLRICHVLNKSFVDCNEHISTRFSSRTVGLAV